VACRLNAAWHSRLPYIHWSNVVRNRRYVCYAVSYNCQDFAVGIWSAPLAANRLTDGHLLLELRRLAVCSQAPSNTASWMIGQMIRAIRVKFPEVIKLISYQDVEVHKGTIYKASNWFIEANVTLTKWTTKSRKRNLEQTTSPKIRWAFNLKKEGK